MNHEKHEKHEKILFSNECYQIQGAIYDVYKEMGCGFLEAVYQECLELEFQKREIPYQAQLKLNLSYKGMPLSQSYFPDFLCHNNIIIEIKAVKEILPQHKAQLMNYLRATKLSLGLLVNFGAFPKVQIVRLAN